jgi:hypothetical protein
MNAQPINYKVNGYSRNLPRAPEFFAFLNRYKKARYGNWSVSHVGQQTGVRIYERDVYYDGAQIGKITARQGKWIAYEGLVPRAKEPTPPNSSKRSKKDSALSFADPSREPINLIYILGQKDKSEHRRDGWKTIPFP